MISSQVPFPYPNVPHIVNQYVACVNTSKHAHTDARTHTIRGGGERKRWEERKMEDPVLKWINPEFLFQQNKTGHNQAESTTVSSNLRANYADHSNYPQLCSACLPPPCLHVSSSFSIWAWSYTGHSKGFFLLKGSLSCYCCLFGGQALSFSQAPGDHVWW